VIQLMAWMGLVWDVQRVPSRIYDEARQLRARRQAGLPGRPEPTPPMFEAFELAEDVEG
jgi:hypothetical protein